VDPDALHARLAAAARRHRRSLNNEAIVCLADHDEPVASEQVLQLATSSGGCSAYDCEFVAAAQQLGVPLVTEDRAILTAFPGLARSLDPFSDGSRSGS